MIRKNQCAANTEIVQAQLDDVPIKQICVVSETENMCVCVYVSERERERENTKHIKLLIHNVLQFMYTRMRTHSVVMYLPSHLPPSTPPTDKLLAKQRRLCGSCR